MRRVTVKRIVSYVVLLAIVVIPLELMSYWAGFEFLIPRDLVYSPSEISAEDYQHYLAIRHDELGWTKERNQEDFDEIGSRVIPLFPDPFLNKSCVSIYGDSYTYSNRATSEEAWSNQLSGLLDCRVSNFGVSGYGTDQAFMRFLLNKKDSAPIVILNHFVNDIARNVNQYWGVRFTDRHHRFFFKPRFILDEDGALERIPIPSLTYEEVLKMQEDPAKWLPHEYFLPNGHYGSPRFRFPYTLALIRTFWHQKFLALYRSEPRHALFYRMDHPTGSLQLTARIFQEFSVSAKAAGRIPIVTIIPYLSDMLYHSRNDRWIFEPLIRLSDHQSYRLVNIGQEITKRITPEMYSSLYQGEGHMNARGDRLLAEILSDLIHQHNLLQPALD